MERISNLKQVNSEEKVNGSEIVLLGTQDAGEFEVTWWRFEEEGERILRLLKIILKAPKFRGA